MLWYPIGVCLLLGAALIALWSWLILRGAVPELKAGLASIRFHIAAELLTAATLLVGAVELVVADGATARLVAASGLGAVAYSTVNSPGYYADRGERATVAVFMVLGAVAVSAIAVLCVA